MTWLRRWLPTHSVLQAQAALTGFDDKIVAMYAHGMTSLREVRGRQLRPLLETLRIKCASRHKSRKM